MNGCRAAWLKTSYGSGRTSVCQMLQTLMDVGIVWKQLGRACCELFRLSQLPAPRLNFMWRRSCRCRSELGTNWKNLGGACHMLLMDLCDQGEA